MKIVFLRILVALFIAAIICLPALAGDRATLNAGSIKTELWANGLMGDTTDVVSYPAGWYPYVNPSALFKIGGLWAGGSIDGKKTFGVSSVIQQGGTFGTVLSDWASDSSGTVSLAPGTRAPLEIRLLMTDTTAANEGVRLGLQAELRAHQWSYAPVDRFYFLECDFKNIGAQAIDSFHLGLYHRPNVTKTLALNTEFLNYCGLDTTQDPISGEVRNLMWVTADSVICANNYGITAPYLGFRLLEAKGPGGVSSELAGATAWWGLSMTPRSDGSKLDPNSRFFYLSRGKFDADSKRRVNAEAITHQQNLIKIKNTILGNVEGVWEVNDTSHLGTNYFAGGHFEPELGAITLGSSMSDRIETVLKAELWASDDTTVGGLQIPVDSVIGIYDNPSGTGTNYYTGGYFNAETGVVILGTPYPEWGSYPMYVDYRYRANNARVSYSFRYSLTKTMPWDNWTLSINPTGLDEVAGVYAKNDSLMVGANYFEGGSADLPQGIIYLGSSIPDDTTIQEDYEAWIYDASWNLNDSLLYAYWMDYTKLVEVLSVTDAGDTFDYFAGGSYNPGTGEILLGTKFPNYASEPVYVTYRYLYLPEVLVKYHANDLAARNVLQTLGPWTLNPGDSAKAVFAVVAGNNLAELQSASDSAKYLWDNPGAPVATDRGSISGMVTRTGGRGPIEGATVKLYEGAIVIETAITDAAGRYFISNVVGGTYDSLTAEALNYLGGSLNPVTVTAGQNNSGLDLSLSSSLADLSGMVTRYDGVTPVVGAEVRLRGVNNLISYSDVYGRYVFASVSTSPGDSLIVTHPVFLGDTLEPLILSADSSVVADMVLHSTTGWIDGTVTRMDGVTPIAGAAISASGPFSAADTTDSRGRYSIAGLPEGSYTIDISSPGYAPYQAVELIVAADSTTIASARLSQALNNLNLIWTRKSSMPEWRYGAASSRAGGIVYVFGGRDYLQATSTVWRYDPAGDTLGGEPWQRMADMPTARYGLGCAAVGDTIIYVLGGYDGNGNALDVMEAYKPGTDTWVSGLPPLPFPRAFMGVAGISDTVYCAAGENNVAAGEDTVVAFVASQNQWIGIKALTGGASNSRTGTVLVRVDSLGVSRRLFAVGGRRIDGVYLTAHVKYNPNTNTWLARAASPCTTAYGLGLEVTDTNYVLGGLNQDGYQSKTAAYNQWGNNWSLQTRAPQAVAYHCGAASDSLGLWIFGGKTSDGYITDEVYQAYRPGAVAGICSSSTGGGLSGVTVTAIRGGQARNSEVTGDDGSYVLPGLEPGLYDLRLFKTDAVDTTLAGVFVRWGRTTLMPVVTGVEGPSTPLGVPESFSLAPSYPNPFRGRSTIQFSVPQSGRVELCVYNILGQRVKTLVSGNLAAGRHSVAWAGDDDRGAKVASGVYLYRLTAGGQSAVRRMTVVR